MRARIKPSHIHNLLKLSRIIDNVIEKIGRLSDWIVILTIAVGFYNVTVRYLGRFIGLRLGSMSLLRTDQPIEVGTAMCQHLRNIFTIPLCA